MACPDVRLRVALRLRLPLKINDNLPVPIDVCAPNPVSGSGNQQFRIQTGRSSSKENVVVPFRLDDEPFDPEFSDPYFAIYGIGVGGLPEHIADRLMPLVWPNHTWSENQMFLRLLRLGLLEKLLI